MINMPWKEGEQQLECVLTKNYRELDGSVSFREEAIMQYFDEFAFGAAEEEIKKFFE